MSAAQPHRTEFMKGLLAALPESFRRGLARLQPSGPVLLGGAALLIGLVTGAGVWLFKQMITWAHTVFFGWIGGTLAPLGPWTIALVPALGGLLVGLLWHHFVGDERYHGVAGIMEAVALVGGRLEYHLGPVKTIAAALSIGAGASVGPEDPISSDRRQPGVPGRAKAALLRRLGPYTGRCRRGSRHLGRIQCAHRRRFLRPGDRTGRDWWWRARRDRPRVSDLGRLHPVGSGSQPAFRVPAYAFHSAGELPLYVGLGILAGLVAAWYVGALYFAKDLFGRWHTPGWLKTTAAGLAVGIVGIWLPQIFGVGYATIDAIFNGPQMAVSLLVVLLIAKLAMTAVSIGGGFPGGVFAPSLFLGATLGDAYGAVAQGMFPRLLIAPQAYAMVGMAAVLAASVHAPLTAIILLFEMTQDYRIILPLMFAVIVALLLAQWLRKDSIYSLALSRKGLRLQRGRDIEVLEGIDVGEVMETDMMTLRETDSLVAATDLFTRTRHHGLPVVNGLGELVGILTVQDIERAQAGTDGASRTVGDACTRDLLVAYPDESIGEALRRMSTRDVGRLPVVDRDHPRRLLGVLRRTDLVRAYDVALTRRTALRQSRRPGGPPGRLDWRSGRRT